VAIPARCTNGMRRWFEQGTAGAAAEAATPAVPVLV